VVHVIDEIDLPLDGYDAADLGFSQTVRGPDDLLHDFLLLEAGKHLEQASAAEAGQSRTNLLLEDHDQGERTVREDL
jgi:hypothetical protein